MIGSRIRLARQASCLSLQQLADRICEMGFPTTKTALFNYEVGKTTPNDQMMQALVRALGIQDNFFYHPDWSDFSPRLQTRLNVVSARRQELLSYIQLELERFLSVVEKMGCQPQPNMPEPYSVSSRQPSGVENAAAALRRAWNAGMYAIPSVCGLLESNGWVLFSLPEVFNLRCVSGVERSSGLLFLFSAPEPFLDNMRENLLRELGRHVLRYDDSEEETVLDRFSRAFLMPYDRVIQEFGAKRSLLNNEEMVCTKQKYGLSRHSIIKRLVDCEVISPAYYETYSLRIQQSHHLLRENTPQALLSFFEQPTTVHMYMKRAKAEGLIQNPPAAQYRFIY